MTLKNENDKLLIDLNLVVSQGIKKSCEDVHFNVKDYIIQTDALQNSTTVITLPIMNVRMPQLSSEVLHSQSMQ